jgi:steroid delta-isomerase-like uncharacterized protein
MRDHTTTIVDAVGRLNRGDVDGYITTLYREDCRFHGFPAPYGDDRDGIARFFRDLVSAVPDAQITATDVVAAGDRVAIRFTLTGTHRGELLGAPATGASLEVEGMTILRFDGERVAERWNRLDDVALLAQLGVLAATG